MRVLARAFAGGLISLVLFYLLFSLVAEFSARQSIVFAILFSIGFHWLHGLAAKPTVRFTPYLVRIHPHWFSLLTDFNLIRPEEWEDIEKSGHTYPPHKYSPFRDLFCYSVVQQSADGERTLIYVNSYKCFVSEIDFLEDLDPVVILREEETIDILRRQKVRLFIKFGRQGYNLGLDVPDWWWEQNKSKCPPCLSEDRDHRYGTCEIVISTIPYKEFSCYWSPVEWTLQHFDNVKKTREEYRKQLGWNSVEPDPDIPDKGFEMENRYFTVMHDAV